MRKLFLACVAVCLSLLSVMLVAQERPDQQVLWKIRQEAITNSQIMRTLHVLTDEHGPRVTGSPRLKVAEDGGAAKRPPRAVELPSSRLDERAARRVHRLACQRHARCRSTRLDARDQRRG